MAHLVTLNSDPARYGVQLEDPLEIEIAQERLSYDTCVVDREGMTIAGFFQQEESAKDALKKITEKKQEVLAGTPPPWRPNWRYIFMVAAIVFLLITVICMR